MKKRYYHIISGLPELAITANELPIDLSTFRDQIKDQLTPHDRELLGMMLAPIDSNNLIQLLTHRKETFDPDGNFTPEELSAGIKMPETLPAYMQQFLEVYGADSEQIGPVGLESGLLDLFVDTGLHIENDFLRSWFEFNHNVRNILAGLNCRKFGLDIGKQVKGNNAVSELIRRSKEKDFNLGKVLPYADQVVSFFEQDNLLTREFELMQLKWEMLDVLTLDYHFSIEIILAYVAKLRLIQRNIQMPEDRGKQKLESLLTSILEARHLPQTFA